MGNRDSNVEWYTVNYKDSFGLLRERGVFLFTMTNDEICI